MASGSPSLYKGSDDISNEDYFQRPRVKMAGETKSRKGSDDISDEDEILNECDPCKTQGTESEGGAYCTECAEYMCAACEKAHRGSKASRDHKIVTGSSLPAMFTKPVSSFVCVKHKLKESDIYCLKHNVVICDTCKIADHKKCKITEVTRQTKRARVNVMVDQTMKEMAYLKRKFECFRYVRKKDEMEAELQIQKCKQDLQKIRERTIDFFDQLEMDFSDEAACKKGQILTDIKKHVTTADAALTQINDKIKSLEKYKKSQDNAAMFSGVEESNSVISIYEEILSRIREEKNPIQINFKPNILLQLESYGTQRWDRLLVQPLNHWW